MSDCSYEPLGIHKCDCDCNDTQLDWCQSALLREQLIEEIRALDVLYAALQENDGATDFCQQQTCREMIHSRQQLYRQIRR